MNRQILPAIFCAVAVLCLLPAARAEKVTLPDGYVPVNLVTNVGGSASSDTTALDSGYTVSKAFDGKYYSDNTRWIGKGSTFPQRAVWTFPVATVVDTVRIYNANAKSPEQSPTVFKVAGSNDGDSWTELDSESGVEWTGANQFRTFGFANVTAYLKYRLEVTQVKDMTSSNGKRLTITEIELYRLNESTFAVSAETPTSGTDSFSVEWTLTAGDGVTAEAGIVLSADETFATATTNSLGTALSAGTYTAVASGLEPDTTYWWKIYADNGSGALETTAKSVTTKGAPVLGTATAAVDGETASFSVALATAAMENTLATSVSVFYGTDGETWTELPLGSASEAQTFSGTVQSLGYGVTCQWYAKATATLAGGRVLSAQTDVGSFTTLYNGDMYVDAAAQNATAPYSTPATAAPDIATALALATDGATIHVAPGLYKISTPLNVTSAVRIIGDDMAPSRVVVSNTAGVAWGNTNHRCVTLNHQDAVVSGITFENGKDYGDGGNVRIDANGGMVTNCVIRNGFTREGDTSAGANIAIVGPGKMTHCKIFGGWENNCSGCTKTSSVYLNASDARIENCLIDGFLGSDVASQPTKNSCGLYIANGVAANCTVMNCTSPYTEAAGVAGILISSDTGRAVNCVSVANVDSNGTVRAFMASQVSRAVNCAFDAIEGEAAIPDGMVNPVVGTASSFFKDYANGDYTPASGGPLYNAGANYEGMASVDLAGNPRKVGRKVDIGCYEAGSSAFVIRVR